MFRLKDKHQIISSDHLSEHEGGNINGPTCIRVPSWCKNKLANYYLYFAHHSGKSIRMSYSNTLFEGWINRSGGVLSLDGMNDAHHHLASPEVYVKSDEKKIYMYFHAPSHSKEEQWTYLAVSDDGINFQKIFDKPLAPFYMRVFQYSGRVYGMTKGGDVWRSDTGTDEFQLIVNPFQPSVFDGVWHNYPGAVRHVALYLVGDSLHILFSKIGDRPECIMHSLVDLSRNESEWRAGPFQEVTRPEEGFEGADLPLLESSAGAAHFPENALRDPYIMQDIDNSFYLFYSFAGEQGIAVTQFEEHPFEA